ncbi:MAG: tyrosine-type recombinase/integrase [Acidimicrobiales bacterium]
MTKAPAGKNRKERRVAGKSAPMKSRSRSAIPQPFKVKDSQGNFTGKWRIIVTVDGVPRSKNGTHEEVVAWTSATLGKRTGIRVVAPSTEMLDDLWCDWEIDNDAKWTSNTKSLYRFAAQCLLPLMNIQLRRLSHEHIEAAYAALRSAGYGQETVKSAHKRLSCCLRWGERKGRITVNPMRRVTPPRVDAPVVKIFTASDWEIFITYAAQVSADFEMFFRLAYDTFARVGELHALRWTDLRPNGQLSITKTMIPGIGGAEVQNATKNKRGRVVTLTPKTREHLAQWRVGRNDTGFIFSLDDGQHPWSARTTAARYSTYQTAARVDLGALGVIRHTGITSWLLRGAPMLMVAQRAGNSPATIEKYYAGFVDGGDATFAAAM